MSRSKIEVKERIAHRYFTWSSEHGCFEYYDHDKKEKVLEPLPFRFVPLDVLGTIKGFSDRLQCGIVSNEVRKVGEQPFTVKTFKNGEFAKGLYKDIKGKINSEGGKYANSVYIAYEINDKLCICNIQLTGASMNAFIDYTKDHKNFLNDGSIIVKSFTNEKKGATKYTKPVFEYAPLSAESNALAVKLDEQLQEYLTGYFKADNKESDALAAAEEEIQGNEPQHIPSGGDGINESDDLPFRFNDKYFKAGKLN
jgi:hypothetical protein